MLKFIIAAFFLGGAISGFSIEDIFEGTELSDEQPAYIYISMGAERVLAQDFTTALEHFAAAAALAKSSPLPLPDAGFFIHFGQAIAYDNLGLEDQCKQALGSMVLTMYAMEEGEAEDNPEFAYDEDVLEEDASPWTFMRKMASLASTPDVRMLLLDLIDHLAKL